MITARSLALPHSDPDDSRQNNKSPVWLIALRLLGVGAMVLFYALTQGARLPLPRKTSLRLAARINRLSGVLFLRVVGAKVNLQGKLYEGPCLLVANHWGWLDPIALCSLGHLLYITSKSVQTHPFLGGICSFAGCQFVSRSPWSLPAEIASARAAAEVASLGFFPEATSGDGNGVLPFRSAFFAVAAATGLPVQPVALRWSDRRIAWYGDMTFAPHLWQMLTIRNFVLEAVACPVVVPQGDDRKALCQKSETAIRAALGF